MWVCFPVGFLESLDDFYILSSGLILLQTTNNVYNYTLRKQVTPESLLAWQRVRVANMMADSGKRWAEVFLKYNSGKWPCRVFSKGLHVCSGLLASQAVFSFLFMSPATLGTYNNQYMVLDLKRVKLNYSLDRGTLYIVEQIPTYVEYSEQTDILRKGILMPQVWRSDEYMRTHVQGRMCDVWLYEGGLYDVGGRRLNTGFHKQRRTRLSTCESIP